MTVVILQRLKTRCKCASTVQLGVVDQYNLVARRRSSDNAPDVGIRIENLGGGVANIPFQNGILPVDPSGHGTINMRAWPVNLVGGELETGKFQGTATITVIVKKTLRFD